MFSSKCAPVQHMVNVLAGVALGPGYALGMAFGASLIRNLLGLGSLLAFPGSMCGALACGLLFAATGSLPAAVLGEMLLNREETVWAGNILMAQYMPEVMKKVAARRIFNATSIGMNMIVTASVSEYVSLKNVASDVQILSLEDLILG